MRFRLGPIPVHVRATFFFLALFLAAGSREAPHEVALSVGIIFVAVLVHELGHAVVGLVFGLRPTVELHGMGGTTSWQGGKELGHVRKIVVSLAGPFAGFLLYGVLLLVSRFAFDPKAPLAAFAMRWAFIVCIGWGIANLAPMLPLDGGNVMRSVIDLVTKGRGEKPARIVSLVVAGAIGVYAAQHRWLWLGFFAVLFGVTNVMALRQAGSRAEADAPLKITLEEALAALEREDGRAAIAKLRPMLTPEVARVASPELVVTALRQYAYALLLEGEWRELVGVLSSHAAIIGAEEMSRYVEAARGVGRLEEAAAIEALFPRPRAANDFG